MSTTFVRKGLGGFEYPTTPGPWHVNSGSVVDSRGNIIATRHSRRRLNHKGDYHGEGNIEPVEADSNCHLLAEAPELYRILLALSELAAAINSQQHAGLDIEPEQWADLDCLTAEAKLIFARMQER